MQTGLILAGGSGRRLGTETPKQFLEIAGKPMLVYSLEAFEKHDLIDSIAVVCVPGWQNELRLLAQRYRISKLRWIVDADESRSLSSYQGLRALSGELSPEDIVLIHDAARPFITHRIISDNIKAVLRYGAANTVIPAVDTLLRSMDSQIADKIVDRRALYLSQTPQSFQYDLIMRAYKKFFENGKTTATCDCSVALMAGNEVGLCTGSRMNIKVTTAEDLTIAELYAGVYTL
ncbi:MAG TPA: 2-C-methyl-D-erythritol 4-phosphate cytidylyltransferase [Ruminococcaceae bacterium]|nr:2-C-methyl-D-erythritol 4-phosphate cytidylyltransferase [Oscillospiraceae bacterium]